MNLSIVFDFPAPGFFSPSDRRASLCFFSHYLVHTDHPSCRHYLAEPSSRSRQTRVCLEIVHLKQLLLAHRQPRHRQPKARPALCSGELKTTKHRQELAALYSEELKITKHRQELGHLVEVLWVEVPPNNNLEVYLVERRSPRLLFLASNRSSNNNLPPVVSLGQPKQTNNKAASLVASNSNSNSKHNNHSNPSSAKLLWRHHNLSHKNPSPPVFGPLGVR